MTMRSMSSACPTLAATYIARIDKGPGILGEDVRVRTRDPNGRGNLHSSGALDEYKRQEFYRYTVGLMLLALGSVLI